MTQRTAELLDCHHQTLSRERNHSTTAHMQDRTHNQTVAREKDRAIKLPGTSDPFALGVLCGVPNDYPVQWMAGGPVPEASVLAGGSQKPPT